MNRTQAHYDPELKSVVVPAKPHTVESLVADVLGRRKRAGVSAYRVAKESGLTINAVNHFFKGYVGTTEGKEGLINDPERVGRVRLDSFLKIVQALGYDVEIVLREKPGRGEL